MRAAWSGKESAREHRCTTRGCHAHHEGLHQALRKLRAPEPSLPVARSSQLAHSCAGFSTSIILCQVQSPFCGSAGMAHLQRCQIRQESCPYIHHGAKTVPPPTEPRRRPLVPQRWAPQPSLLLVSFPPSAVPCDVVLTPSHRALRRLPNRLCGNAARQRSCQLPLHGQKPPCRCSKDRGAAKL